MDEQQPEVNNTLMKLMAIKGINLGVTELSQSLTIDEVTDIFIPINSQGVVLSQADFAMSKISSDDRYGGNVIRNTIPNSCPQKTRTLTHKRFAHAKRRQPI